MNDPVRTALTPRVDAHVAVLHLVGEAAPEVLAALDGLGRGAGARGRPMLRSRVWSLQLAATGEGWSEAGGQPLVRLVEREVHRGGGGTAIADTVTVQWSPRPPGWDAAEGARWAGAAGECLTLIEQWTPDGPIETVALARPLPLGAARRLSGALPRVVRTVAGPARAGPAARWLSARQWRFVTSGGPEGASALDGATVSGPLLRRCWPVRLGGLTVAVESWSRPGGHPEAVRFALAAEPGQGPLARLALTAAVRRFGVVPAGPSPPGPFLGLFPGPGRDPKPGPVHRSTPGRIPAWIPGRMPRRS